jgi:hypothetical protein
LDEPKKLLCVGNIGQAHFSVRCKHFQSVTVRHGFHANPEKKNPDAPTSKAAFRGRREKEKAGLISL